ncbi:hypothetical protein B0H17DRAFT_1051939, partial [Mycena rosella]
TWCTVHTCFYLLLFFWLMQETWGRLPASEFTGRYRAFLLEVTAFPNHLHLICLGKRLPKTTGTFGRDFGGTRQT